jgi:drug/metabolite transporter (DMT)-like permease
MTSEPVFGAVLAFLWLGQSLEAPQLLGGLLVLVGVVLAQRSRPQLAAIAEPAALPPEPASPGP